MQIEEIEEQYTISLPEEYRRFLLDVGNGGVLFNSIDDASIDIESSPSCLELKFNWPQQFFLALSGVNLGNVYLLDWNTEGTDTEKLITNSFLNWIEVQLDEQIKILDE